MCGLATIWLAYSRGKSLFAVEAKSVQFRTGSAASPSG
jgi:hypothetical protein